MQIEKASAPGPEGPRGPPGPFGAAGQLQDNSSFDANALLLVS